MNMSAKKKKTIKKYIFCYTMLIFAIWSVVTYFIVNPSGLIMAFQTEEGGPLTLDNFRMLFAEFTTPNSNIWIALINTLKYFVLNIIKLPITFIIAYFLFKKIRGYKAYRVIFFMPSMIAPIILVYLFKDLIRIGGPVDILLNKWFGYQMPNILYDFSSSTNVILFFVLWSGFGASLLLFVGAMNRIPTEILDAAAIDGCNKFQEFTKIITPLCWDQISTLVLLSTIGIFGSTGPILYFTGGDYGTNTIAFWQFMQTLNGSYYYPSAVGMFFTLINVPIILLTRALLKRGGEAVEY